MRTKQSLLPFCYSSFFRTLHRSNVHSMVLCCAWPEYSLRGGMEVVIFLKSRISYFVYEVEKGKKKKKKRKRKRKRKKKSFFLVVVVVFFFRFSFSSSLFSLCCVCSQVLRQLLLSSITIVGAVKRGLAFFDPLSIWGLSLLIITALFSVSKDNPNTIYVFKQICHCYKEDDDVTLTLFFVANRQE